MELLLGAIAFAELLDLVAALEGILGGGDVAAGGGDGVGNFLPVGGAEVAAVEGVPFGAVGVDEGQGFLVGPARGRDSS